MNQINLTKIWYVDEYGISVVRKNEENIYMAGGEWYFEQRCFFYFLEMITFEEKNERKYWLSLAIIDLFSKVKYEKP